MIDWKRKLSSRKFWSLLAGAITGLVVFITSPSRSPEAICGLVGTFISFVAYMFAEGIADSGHGSDKSDEDDGGEFYEL